MARFIKKLSFKPKLSPMFDYIDAHEEFRTPTFLPSIRLTEETTPSIRWLPTKACLVTKHKTLPDIFHVEEPFAVSERVKDAIESVEPDVHQFFPITLYRSKKGEPFEGNYYLLNICQKIAGVIIEKSSLRKYWDKDGVGPFILCKNTSDDYRSIRADITFGKHLWRDEEMLFEIFFSEKLHQILAAWPITGIDEFYTAYEI